MYALKSTAGRKPSYARFTPGDSPIWGPVENSTKFPSESALLLFVIRTPPVSHMFVKGPLEIAELDYTQGKLRYRLPDGIKSLEHLVFSSDGSGRSYIVRVDPNGSGSCTCLDFKYRHGEDGTPCKHMRTAFSYLATQRGDVYFDVAEIEDKETGVRF